MVTLAYETSFLSCGTQHLTPYSFLHFDLMLVLIEDG